MVTRAPLLLLLVGVFAGVFTAAAEASDHVWRVWCDGTARETVFDTSKECWEAATTRLAYAKAGCRDPQMRRLAVNAGVIPPGGCARIEATHDCTCRPERVE
jgi:hypothetical protein